MQGMNLVPRSPAMSTLHLGPVKKCILLGQEEKEPRRVETASGANERHYFDNGVGASAGPLYCVCACECMCDRWEDVKAPLPLMLKPAL